MDFNINETVRVKLTDHGRSTHAADDAIFWASLPGVKAPEYKAPREDAEGWSEWQMWSLMEVFGPHIYMGGPMCFEMTIQIIEPKPWMPPAQDPMAAVRALCS